MSLEPSALIRLIVGSLLFVATLVALGLAVTGVEPRAILLVGMFWGLYGLITGLVDGVLEPVTDFVLSAFQNAGLVRAGGDYSSIEALVANGHLEAAASDYLDRAHAGNGDAEALVRRAMLLAGPLQSAPMAVDELENFRANHRPGVADDIRIGAALADLYEHKLDDPGRAMSELRRLIDLYPSARAARRLRSTLAALREERFGKAANPAQGMENEPK